MKNRGARLSRAIRDLRGELELTQAELAELLGLHEQTVSRWERGMSRPTHWQHEVLELLDRAPTLAAAALRDREAAPPLRLARAICAADTGGRGQLALSRRSGQPDSGLAGGLP